MKSNLIILFFAVMSFGVMAQQKAYLVINEATWCPYCKANGERIHKLMQDEYSTKTEIKIIHHDLTSPETIKKSDELFKSLGITKTMKKYNDCAMIFLINAKTKKAIEGTKIKNSNEEINALITKVMKLL